MGKEDVACAARGARRRSAASQVLALCLGVAQGMAHLHACVPPVLHRGAALHFAARASLVVSPSCVEGRSPSHPWLPSLTSLVLFQTLTRASSNSNHLLSTADLKSANLLVDDLGSVKIADFGLSKVFNDGRTQMTGGLGTFQW